MTRRVQFYRWDELPLGKVTEMVAQKTIASAHGRLTQAYLKKGAVVPLHVHPADLLVYVLQGALRVRVDGEDAELTVREGEVVIVPGGVRHQAESLDDTFLLSVDFSHPPDAADTVDADSDRRLP